MEEIVSYKFYVYVITDPRDSQPFYVGKGEGHRMAAHETAAKGNHKHATLPHHDRIREILASGLRPQYEKVMFNVDEPTALAKERALIEFYGRQWNGTGILLNKSTGGTNSGITEKPVWQYDLAGNFIAEHQSAKAASKHTTGNQSYITQCCKGRRKSSGGYQWTYKDAPAPTFTKEYYTAVVQYDLDMNCLAAFKSLTEAQETTGVPLRNISTCCRGKSKTAGGYIWKYGD